jgi:PAS domain S-box-containing protein
VDTNVPKALGADRLIREARRYEALSTDGGLLVWAMDPHLRPTGPNAAWERYTGQSRDQYFELGWLEAIRESDRDRCLREIQINVPREQPFEIELAIRRFDGVYRRHLIRSVPVRDEDGVLVEWVGTATDVEDQRATVEQLEAMSDRLRLTYEAAGVGTWEWFPKRGELQWSNEMYRMLGLEPGDLRPSIEAWVSAIHPDDVVMTARDWVEAVRTSDAVSQEFRLVRRDGSVIWVLSRASVVRDDQGEVERVLGLNLDVTERRAMEELMAAALAEHRDLHERLVALTDGADPLLRAATPEGVRSALCDLAARVLPADAYAIWIFDTATSTWEAETSRGLGDAFVQRLPGTELTFTEPLVADTLDGEMFAQRAAAYREERIRSLISVPLSIGGVCRGAIAVYFRTPHMTTSAERQVAVALGHLGGAALGNAEARQRQEQLRAEAERHSRRMAFLAEASSLFSTLDYEESFRRLSELSVPWLADWCVIHVERDGILSRVAVAHPDPAKLSLAEEMYERYGSTFDNTTDVARVLRTGKAELFPEISEEQIVAAARDAEQLQRLRFLRLRSAILAPLTARGRTLGVLTLVSSSSNRSYDETDLRFVELVARRAATAIDNARLYEEARIANHAKDEFLALLSHELRTPLNAIMGWAQVLLTPPPPNRSAPPLARGLEIIQRNAQLQADLVDGLLDVARVVTGGLPLSLQVIDAAEAAAAAVEGIRPAATDRGLTVHVTAPPGDYHVRADPNRLQQILSNLLSNAMKFTDRTGRIDVRVRIVDTWCEIEVADTGAGIAPEFLPHVFERFRQADSSSTRRHGGLGLGLWLVHELVRAHGGNIRAASEGIGHGAIFTIRLLRAAE